MTSKEEYIDFCKDNDSVRLFCQPWWLDAVCGEENWEVIVDKKNGNLLGGWPYQLKRKYGLRYLINPVLTQVTGPVINYPKGLGQINKQSFEKKVIDNLIDHLPGFDWLQMNLDYDILNWQPFYWKGFSQTMRYTYIIDNPSEDPDILLTTFSKNARQEIKKARQHLTVRSGLEFRQFYELNQKSFQRQKLEMPLSPEVTGRIINACKEHKNSEILYTIDEASNIHSGLMVVWDNKYLYFLLSGGDQKYRKSGSKFLLAYHAILLAARLGLSVNFEGSMIENIAYFNRQFGARPLPFHQISKVNSRMLRLKFFLFPGK